MPTIEMTLERTTANFCLYKAVAGEEKESFGTLYVAKGDMEHPWPKEVTVTVEDSKVAALWREAERMKRETTRTNNHQTGD